MRAVLIAVLLLAVSSSADAKPPTAVLKVVVNGEPFQIPADGKPVKVVAGDDLHFDLSGSEGEPDRYFVILDDRVPGKR